MKPKLSRATRATLARLSSTPTVTPTPTTPPPTSIAQRNVIAYMTWVADQPRGK